MGKRYGKRERWRQKMRHIFNPPEVVALHRAIYNPHTMRTLRAWARCQREDGTPALIWVEACEYCLDRPES